MVLLLCACAARQVKGSGNSAQEERSLPHYHALLYRLPGELFLVGSDSPAVTIVADDNLLPLIETTVSEDGVLTIDYTQSAGRIDPQPAQAIRVYLNVTPALDQIVLPRASHLQADSLQVNHLKIQMANDSSANLTRLSAAGVQIEMDHVTRLTITGQAAQMEASLSGDCRLDLGELQVQQARLNANTRTTATVWVKQTLDVTLSGAATLYYLGSASVTKDIRDQAQLIISGDK